MVFTLQNMKYEYKTVKLDIADLKEIDIELNYYGKEGYEVVSVTLIGIFLLYTLKKPI